MAAAIYAARAIFSQGWDLMEQAAQFEEQQRGLQGLASQYGMTADAVTRMAKEAVQGQLSLVESSQLASRALMLGFDPAHMAKFLEVAEKLTGTAGGEIPAAFEAMERAAVTGRARGLVQYGIIVDLNKALEDYARAHGISKDAISEHTATQIRSNAILLEAKRVTDLAGESQMSTAAKMNVLKATVKDMQLFIGTVLIRAFGLATGIFQGFAAVCMTVAAAAFSIGKAFTWVLSKLPGPHQAEWKASFENMKILSEAAWKTAQDLAQKGQDNIKMAFAKSTDLAATMKPPKLPGLEGGVDNAKLDKIKALNEQIRSQTAKAELDERQHIEWQANEWRKAGADRVLIANWTAAKLTEIDEKWRKQTAETLDRLLEDRQKARDKQLEDAYRAVEQQNKIAESGLQARLKYEEQIDNYRKARGQLSEEDAIRNKFSRERELYALQIQHLSMRVGNEQAIEEIQKRIVASRQYETFELDALKIKNQEKILDFERKIAEIKLNSDVARLEFIGKENEALDLQFQRKAASAAQQYAAVENNPYLSEDVKLAARLSFLEQEYQLEQEYAQRKAQLWWSNAQQYISFAQQMSTMSIQYAMAEGDAKDAIGRRMLATAIRFLAQMLQQFMFMKAKENLLAAMSASSQTTMMMTAHLASLSMLEAEAVAWAAFLAALAMNPYGGQVVIPAATAMAAVASVAVPAAMAATAIAGAVGAAGSLIEAAAWIAGGIAVGAIGEAAASGIEGGGYGGQSTIGGGTGGGYSLTSPNAPVYEAAAKSGPVINVHIYGNVVDHDKFTRELIPSITKALEDGAH